MECSFRGMYDEALIRRISSAVGSLGNQGTVAVAIDTRPSGPALSDTIISILKKNGNAVHFLGVAPTPVLSYYSKVQNCLGIMVTASHNPETDNGIKMFFNGVEAIDVQPKPAGMPCDVKIDVDIRDSYLHVALAQVDTSSIKRKRPKVIVDCANGTGALYTPHLLRMAGAHVITIDADSSLPFSRDSEPTEKSLSYLPALITALNADFAVAHDADADRCRIITKDGLLNQDVQLLNMASALCKSGETFVTTVEASQMVSDELAKKHIKIEITPVGSNFVAREAKNKSAAFGGEPCGEYIFPKFLLSADGILSALMFTKLYCESGFTDYKPYATIRGKIEIASGKGGSKNTDETKQSAMKEIEMALKKDKNAKIVSDLDGVLFIYNDARVLVRKSNTQDIIRITCEHKDEKKAQAAYDEIKRIVGERCR